jgi:hypothetical protein
MSSREKGGVTDKGWGSETELTRMDGVDVEKRVDYTLESAPTTPEGMTQRRQHHAYIISLH